MRRRHSKIFRKIALLAVATAFASLLVLWSWNTLAPLFGGPMFQLRHAAAFLIALAGLRVAFGPRVGRRRHEAQPEVRS
jgi:hypothetical protein